VAWNTSEIPPLLIEFTEVVRNEDLHVQNAQLTALWSRLSGLNPNIPLIRQNMFWLLGHSVLSAYITIELSMYFVNVINGQIMRNLLKRFFN
jgi:hypothetical protein